MIPIEFARKHFPHHKVKGEEIVPALCPFCKGGNKGDKNTFALNIDTGAYNCKRGSCGAAGSFSQLMKEFGEVTYKPQPFVVPQTRISPAQQRVEKYLKARCFTRDTWERRKVGESEGNIAFPYYENGKLVLMKFRKPEKYQGKGQKAWREKGGKAVFWGMDDCTPDKPLVIVEGEMDALALDECGVENVVSVPSGAEDLTCIENCWDWLEQFKKIIIWPDSDEPGQEMCRKLIAKLGEWRCYIVNSEYKDANESLYKAGKETTTQAVKDAKEVPISGLVRLADVKKVDLQSMDKVYSKIYGIDKTLGGFFMGMVTVWTGINSHGKSTLLGQILLESIEQGYSVCAFSGEQPASMFQYNIDLQAAGVEYAETHYDNYRQEEVYFVNDRIKGFIHEWYKDRFFLYDTFGTANDDDILKRFEFAARRHDCRTFLVDNLMITSFTDKDNDFYRRQSNFIGKVKNFAHKFGVHVHVVAHPRKSEGRLTKMDVAGSGDITNRADNVLSVFRIEHDDDKQKYPGVDTIVDIFKNRLMGIQNKEIWLNFNPEDKRFAMCSRAEQLKKHYAWTTLLKEDDYGPAPF